MKGRPKRDVRYGVSVSLLIVFVLASVTGIVADVWDLNDFVYHTYAGYAMVVLSLGHLFFVGPHLVAYIRRRLRRIAAPRRGPSAPSEAISEGLAGVLPGLISRRGFIGFVLGGVGGFVLGRNWMSGPPDLQGRDIGEVYHAWSKPGVSSFLGSITAWGQRPPLYKAYPEVQQVTLPPPGEFRGVYTEEAIERRRSIRTYADQAMTLGELSCLLHYSDGITLRRFGQALRSAPSAGALYPIETYVVAHRVAELPSGLYHYGVQDHRLHQLRVEDLRTSVVQCGLMQDFLGQANVVLVYSAIFQRLRWRYRERTYRYALLEAGHIAQNGYLVATSMGMGACAVGAFMDGDLNALLDIDGREEAALYMLAVGKSL
jgi:SagB-type dehydrogenase family enzyme